jgi:hypothetical protein
MPRLPWHFLILGIQDELIFSGLPVTVRRTRAQPATTSYKRTKKSVIAPKVPLTPTLSPRWGRGDVKSLGTFMAMGLP